MSGLLVPLHVVQSCSLRSEVVSAPPGATFLLIVLTPRATFVTAYCN